MTNTNTNLFKNFNKDKPKPIIKNMQNIDTVNPKIILEVMNEIKSKQTVSLSSNIHQSYDSSIKHEIVSTNITLKDIIPCTYHSTAGFCKCCGNFTEYSLRRRRFY